MICTRTIKLRDDCYAFVSENDYEEINKYRWYLHPRKDKRRSYAFRTEKIGGKIKYFYMHRQVMGNPLSEVDHINGNGLDNRRENLRLATREENTANTRSPGGKSKYKGVYFSEKNKSWVVQISTNKNTRCVRCIYSEKIASLIYDLMAYDRYKDFAYLNNKRMIDYFIENGDLMDNLKPCRFCYEPNDIQIRESGVCWAECSVCKCRGPVSLFKKDAVRLWNEGCSDRDKKENKENGESK